MKKKLNLFKLNEREGRQVKGGGDLGCSCGCAYVNCGGSSSLENETWNNAYNLKSPHMKPVC